MARDYKEKRLRSSDEKLLEEGAYVCVPVETLETVRSYIDAAELTEGYKVGLRLIKNELFPEESR